MQLPQFQSTGQVQDEASAGYRRVGEAAQRLGSVIEAGMTAYGQEMVKTQTQDAHLALTSQLDDVEQELKTREAIPVEEAKARLGSKFDALPDTIKNTPEVEMQDPTTGQVVKRRADIPTWAIAGELYDDAAEKAVQGSSGRISGGGWQGAFQRAAMGDVLQRRSRLMGQQLQAMHQYQVNARVQQILKYAQSGDYGPQGSDSDLGTAGLALNGSVDLLGAETVSKLREQVLEIKQTKPVYDAMRMVQIPAYRPEGLAQLNAALNSLGDPKQWTSIPPEKQAQLAHSVRNAIDSVRDMVDKQAGATLAFEIANANISEQNPLRVDAGKAYADLNKRFQEGKIDAATFTSANRILGDHIKDRNDGAKQVLGEVAGKAMDEFMAIGPDGRPRLSFSNVTPQTIAQLRTFGKDGQDVIESLIKWDQSNESHARNMRQLPTEDQDARALALERAIRRSPAEFRSMPTADLFAVLQGKRSIPGEPDAPAVELSSRDMSRIRDLLGANAGQPGSEHVVSFEKIADEEFGAAFGITKKKSKDWPVRLRSAYREVTDEISRWATAEKAAGRNPDDAAVREHLKAPGGPLERLARDKNLFGQEKGPRTPLEAGTWKPPEASATTPAAVTGKVRVKAPNGKQYDVDEKGLDAWLKAHPGWSR